MNNDPLQTVLDYIDEHIDEYLSVGKLSEIANYSAPQLFRLFMSGMDITPIHYALRRKLYYAAKELVRSDTKVIDIATAFGFESHDSFSRAFKRLYGVAPSVFRKNACRLNKFYRYDVYCIAGYSAPPSLENSGNAVESLSSCDEKVKRYEDFCERFGFDPDIVTMPAVKLIGVQRPVSGGVHEAFYEMYDRVFRNAPNRKYPHSENATHGLPCMAPDGRTLYFVGIEVISFADVPDGAESIELPE